MDAEDFLIQKCKSLIETKLGWEGSDLWSNHDFQMLSIKIQDATGVNLSIATLKRIWGKVKYDSRPTITTLNTLAKFTGYENWREFRQNNHTTGNGTTNGVSHEIAPAPAKALKTSRSLRLWRSGLIGTALCGGVAFILLYFVSNENLGLRSVPDYTFSSKKVVSEGVPNSVIFDYDASAAPSDSIYIQQSWDERLRTRVSRDQRQHTSIYYTPGFFQAKLVVENEIVKEHGLLIKSNGWLALVKQNPVPAYFKNDDFLGQGGVMRLPIEKLKEKNVPLQPEVPMTSYYNVRDFGDIRTDNFVFETEVRSDYKEDSGICQHIRMLLLTEGAVMIVPLSIPGCVSDLELVFGDEGVDGKKADLSAFGADVSQWVKVRFESVNRAGKIFINDKLVYETGFESSSKIVGILYRFQGTGSVNRVRLSNTSGSAVFEDDF